MLEYIDAVTGVGHRVLRGVSLALGLDEAVVRPAPHCGADRAVPHLPVPAAGTPKAEAGMERR